MIALVKSIIYGFISGLTEIIPVSSRGHQSIMMQLFGMSQRDPLLDLMVHIGILACVIFCCRVEAVQFLLSFNSSPRIRRSLNKQTTYQNRLLLTSGIFMVIALFFYNVGTKYESKTLLIALFMAINGLILFIPDYIRQGNKHAGLMGPFDGMLMGISSALCIFPGISRVATGNCIALVRGADKQSVFNWILLLTIPAMAVMIILDFIGLFVIGLSGFSIWIFLGYILAIAAAFAGCYIAIMLMRFLSVNSSYSAFAFYNWGTALFAFILYLVAY